MAIRRVSTQFWRSLSKIWCLSDSHTTLLLSPKPPYYYHMSGFWTHGFNVFAPFVDTTLFRASQTEYNLVHQITNWRLLSLGNHLSSLNISCTSLKLEFSGSCIFTLMLTKIRQCEIHHVFRKKIAKFVANIYLSVQSTQVRNNMKIVCKCSFKRVSFSVKWKYFFCRNWLLTNNFQNALIISRNINSKWLVCINP